MRLARAAGADLHDILQWSRTSFGYAAADRYRALIDRAFEDLASNPGRSGVRSRSDIPAHVRIYHLVSSKESEAPSQVKTPRHFIVFSLRGKIVNVIRILHDSRDLTQHVR